MKYSGIGIGQIIEMQTDVFNLQFAPFVRNPLAGIFFQSELLNGAIHKDRATAEQSLLRWLCPAPSSRAIPVLCQNLESKV